MPIKNTEDNYGSVAKSLHWTTAALFLASYCTVYYRHWFTEPRTAENMIAFQLHLSVGISIGVIVLLRLIWRFQHRSPQPESSSRMARGLIYAGHFALYATMIIMPLSGYLGTGGGADFFFLFEVPKFEDTWLFSRLVSDGLGMSFDAFEKPMDLVHKQIFGQWLAWLLIAGHILAALYHHFIARDRTLEKMTFGNRVSSDAGATVEIDRHSLNRTPFEKARNQL